MTDRGNATVLVVDDETSLVELFAAFLTPKYEVRTATTGAEALEQADGDVDAILLDRRMPEMSGGEVLSRLREQGVDAQVALLTGVEPDADIVDMPFDDYMTKPVSRDDLLALVEVLLRRATYDENSQRFFSLASKKAALEAAGNTGGAEYVELTERMERLREDIESTLDDLAFENVVGAAQPSES